MYCCDVTAGYGPFGVPCYEFKVPHVPYCSILYPHMVGGPHKMVADLYLTAKRPSTKPVAGSCQGDRALGDAPDCDNHGNAECWARVQKKIKQIDLVGDGRARLVHSACQLSLSSHCEIPQKHRVYVGPTWTQVGVFFQLFWHRHQPLPVKGMQAT